MCVRGERTGEVMTVNSLPGICILTLHTTYTCWFIFRKLIYEV